MRDPELAARAQRAATRLPGPQTGTDQPLASAKLAAGAHALVHLRLFWCLALCACRAAVSRSFSLAEAGSQLWPSVR